MKILMIHPHDLFSPSEPWTVRPKALAAEFTRQGHEVKQVFFPFERPVKLYKPFTHADGYELIPYSRRRRALLKNIALFCRLAKWAEVVHFQKCHSWASLPAIFAAFTKGKALHYDWDDWEYGIYACDPSSRVEGACLKMLEYMIPSLVNTISAASTKLRETAMALGVPQWRIVEGHVGADLDRFNPSNDGAEIRRRHGLAGPVALYVGQLHGAQYAGLFLEAAVKVIKVKPEARFVLVGGGYKLAELRGTAQRLGVDDRVVFAGMIPYEKIPAYVAMADVAVACFEDNDQQATKSPLKIAEYLAAGKAIVASAVGEVPEMIGDAGILVKPGDAAALADGMIGLLDDPDLRRQLSVKARRRAELKYNWTVTASHMLRAYKMGMEEMKNGGTEPCGRLKTVLLCSRHITRLMDGERPVPGPAPFQLDVTGICNNDCIACWCNSPLVRDDPGLSANTIRDTLAFDTVIKILDDAKRLEVREIYLSGGGEPFMHADIVNIIREVKRRGFECTLNTNFTLVDEKRADELVKLGLDYLAVSLWAAIPETYAKLHPNKTGETFNRMKAVLEHLIRVKRNARPMIRIHNVITALNCDELPAMVEFARGLNVDTVEFAMINAIPGKTDGLLVTEEQRMRLVKNCDEIASRAITRPDGTALELRNFELFRKRISTVSATTGRYDVELAKTVPCYAGWLMLRILSNGDVTPCLKGHRISIGNVHDKSLV